jgi:hypothetical protein
MVRPDIPDENYVEIVFGGGLNTRTSETAIGDSECADGQNFDLDLDNSDFRRRKPFDLAATATNTERINGFGQLLTTGSVLTTWVQAGATVYIWDGADDFNEIATVNGGARLRGPLSQNFMLEDIGIVTDLAQQHPVLEFDGSAMTAMEHNLGSFYARYAAVDFDRAFYANVRANIDLPHVLVGSERENHDNLSVSDRASSSLSAADPFYLTAPDLRPIKGLIRAFNRLTFPTMNGEIYHLTGSDPSDFSIDSLYQNVRIEGEEAIAYIGNDIAYGQGGKGESLFATQNLGETESDDLTREIANQVKNIKDWIVRYNPRTSKVYFFNPSGNQVFVFHKDLTDDRSRRLAQSRSTALVSPWSRWRTQHAMSFQPTATMVLRDPVDGLERLFMGGPAGEIWRVDGTGGQDGGTADIEASRTSKYFRTPVSGKHFKVAGTIWYRKTAQTTVTLTFLIGGTAVRDQDITITLPALSGGSYFGGDAWFGGDFYFGVAFEQRLSLQNFDGPDGQNAGWQVRATVDGASDFAIARIELYFRSQ